MLKLTRRPDSGKWYARGSYLGVAINRSLKTGDRKQAEILLAKIQKQIFDREGGRSAGPSFGEAALAYMKAGGERRFLAPLIKYFGETRCAAIDQAAVSRAAVALYPNAGPATRNRQVYTPASSVLRHIGLTLNLRRPKQPIGIVRWLTPEEATRLIDACGNHLKPLVVFMLYTGARAGEALWLDWHEVKLAKADVHFIKTKNGHPRYVPLHPAALDALASLPHRDGAVFRRPDGRPYERPQSPSDTSAGSRIGTAFTGALKRAGIENFRVHDLRHTWATWHYAEHRDLIRLQRLGGWKTLSMVTRYAHQSSDADRESINALPVLATREIHVRLESDKAESA